MLGEPLLAKPVEKRLKPRNIIRAIETSREAMRRSERKVADYILANRREHPPQGIAGGGDAEPGRNWVERADGSREELGATGSAEMQPGDAFVILTPGGGGYGA